MLKICNARKIDYDAESEARNYTVIDYNGRNVMKGPNRYLELN